MNKNFYFAVKGQQALAFLTPKAYGKVAAKPTDRECVYNKTNFFLSPNIAKTVHLIEVAYSFHRKRSPSLPEGGKLCRHLCAI